MTKPVPKTYKLQALLLAVGLRQGVFARGLKAVNGGGISDAALSQILHHGIWPKSVSASVLINHMRQTLTEAGAASEAIEEALGELKLPKSEKKTQPQNLDIASLLEDPMILLAQNLSPEAKKHFKAFRSPFADPESADDVFETSDIRYVRESMYQTAKNGGFLAVVSESGGGKSTLRKDLIERIRDERQNIIVVQPFVVGSEENDAKGKTLKSAHISEAIFRAVSPLGNLRGNTESRMQQLTKALTESRRVGNTHCLIIEEAHSLPAATLKHLKRFYELEDGFKKLISIVLIGQPELKVRLTQNFYEVREVVQRCEIVELPPLDRELESYLRFKFERAGLNADKVFSPNAYDALRQRLTVPTGRRGSNERISMLYPLAVGNLVIASMNLAAQLGNETVDAAVIEEV